MPILSIMIRKATFLTLLLATLVAGKVAAETMDVYKSPTCGCCTGWIEHMEAEGFEVTVHNMDNVNPIKQESGLPPALASCHTAFVGGYLLEGHVPAEDVQRLLSEKPDIKGLAVPGMPAGENVPGMEVPGRRAKFTTYVIPDNAELSAQPEIFATHE